MWHVSFQQLERKSRDMHPSFHQRHSKLSTDRMGHKLLVDKTIVDFNVEK